MTDDLKAAIERVKRHECCSLAEYDTVMDLAEIGRLAVEFRASDNASPDDKATNPVWREWADRTNAKDNAMRAAADAFLAGRGT